MKKIVKIILCTFLIILVVGCGSKAADSANNTVDPAENTADTAAATTDPVLADTESTPIPGAPVEDTLKEFNPIDTGAEGIDVDLTTLSSTMVYSQVYNMIMTPEGFIGKKVKMQGLMVTYYDEATDKRYFCCIIQDATACCAQGIEFELAGDFKYPEDYPADGETICVEGIFDTYDEAGLTYVTLRKARFL